MYLINTILGFLIAQFFDILCREKESQASPKKFDLIFFLKDTWLKIIVSLLLSILISTALYLQPEESKSLIEVEWLSLVYLIIGAAPELVIQKLKNRFGIFQTKSEINGYQRKTKKNERSV